MTIKLDKSAISIVVICTDCPHWYGFALDRYEGWKVGARHQQQCHPGEKQALQRLSDLKKGNATRRAGR